MKTLTLIRHAKSSWKNAYLLDIDRPLNKRGKRDAPKMGGRLADQGTSPELIVSSPATRAMVTAETIALEIDYPIEDIVVDERIYMADVDDLLSFIQRLDDTLEHVMLFGHNPGLTDLVNTLSPSQTIDNVPTCGVIEMDFETNTWASVGDVGPARMNFDYPKKTSP
jgi:phosphohistidine phosphatase